MLSRILKPDRIEFHYLKTGKRYDMSGDYALPFETILPDHRGLIIPIYSQGRTLGEFLLWQKRSGDPYTKEDRALLRTFANQATVALEKAELYEQLKQHSDNLEDKVQERTRHLEELRTSQREFIDDISHALQTPLTVLTSTIEIVTKNISADQHRHVSMATRSIEELSRLTSNLLALARIESLPGSDAPMSFNLSESIERIVEYVHVICVNNEIQFSANIAPEIYLDGNKRQIEEAITNILSNAVRYTAGCPVRNIHIQLVRNNDSVEISIKDTGIGIGEERLPHIFERFYRAQDAQGSGIGLAITKRIVERHGGRIETESILGNGTIMTIHLPILSADEISA
jgi:signal transduction histidine kinase